MISVPNPNAVHEGQTVESNTTNVAFGGTGTITVEESLAKQEKKRIEKKEKKEKLEALN